MSSTKKNIVANFIGSIWGGIITLVLVPLYIHFLGIEAFGLIGFFTSLQILLSLLDMGLGAAIQRDLARHSSIQSVSEESYSLVKVLDTIYWTTAFIIGILIFLLAPWIANSWLNVTNLTVIETQSAIRLMGVSLAIRWPAALYNGGLMGLQKQVAYNGIKIATDSIRGFGAILVLWIISPTIIAFLTWQILSDLISTGLLRRVLWRYLPKGNNSSGLQFKQLKRVWKFATGMGGTAILVIILLQMDKVVLSRMLTMDKFGYYTVASTLSMGLTLLIRPIFSAIYPKLTQLVELKNDERVKKLYHDSCQLMSALILPTALLISFFSKEVLYLWTHNPTVADQSHRVLSILIIGTALNGVMNIPYALQLANGWTRLTFYMNLIAVIILGPLIILMTMQYGVEGAAVVWVLLNSGYVFIGIHVMHRRLLADEKWNWYIKDVAIPTLAVLLALVPAKLIFWDGMSEIQAIIGLPIILCLTYLSAALATPAIRLQLLRWKLVLGGNSGTPLE